MSKSCTDQRDSCKTSRFRDQTCSEQARFQLNEQVEGPNLLENCKVGTFRTGNELILYRTSKNRHFVQEVPKSCTGWSGGLANKCGGNIVAPPLALRPSQRQQQEALHGAFKGSICASAVASLFATRKQLCSIPHNYRVLSTVVKIYY